MSTFGNNLAEHTVNIGIQAALFAGAAVLTAHPIGAAAAAGCGVVGYLAGRAVSPIFGANDADATGTAKFAALAVGISASIGAMSATASYLGTSMSLGSSATLMFSATVLFLSSSIALTILASTVTLAAVAITVVLGTSPNRRAFHIR